MRTKMTVGTQHAMCLPKTSFVKTCNCMLTQKIQVIPAVTEFDTHAPKPLVFWKRISQGKEKELHLFFLIEGRNDRETHELGKELWQMIGSYTNELVINQRGLVNPENVCEAILKICNNFLANWVQKSRPEKWSDLSIIIAVSTPLAIYFTRIGEARIVLFRSNQIILADENISHPGSPQFSSPFSEIAGGPLSLGDRFLIASPEIISSFSFDELLSLATPAGLSGVFHNLLRSLEIQVPLKNAGFILGSLTSAERPDIELKTPPLADKLKEVNIGELNFIEFSPINFQEKGVVGSFIPWQEILLTIGKKIFWLPQTIIKIFAKIFSPLPNKISSMSLAKKVTLFAGLALFIIFLFFVGSSLINQPGPEPVKTDYQAAYSEAERLKAEADSAIIYQDEEKARKNLAQTSAILEEVSSSSEWGIKALKLKREVSEQLSILDKAQGSEAIKLWTVPENKGILKKISLLDDMGRTAITTQNAFLLKEKNNSMNGEEFGKVTISDQGKTWLLATSTDLILINSQNKSYLIVNPKNREISDQKDLGQEAGNTFSAAGSFGSSIYLFDQLESQIKLFSYENKNLRLTRQWLNQDLKEEFKDGPATSMTIDGSLFLITKSGALMKLSGGKKSSWSGEKPAESSQGEKLALFTLPDYKYLYLLDPEKNRVVIFEKDGGKLAGQVKNSTFGQAVDFQVDEGKKIIYIATAKVLFKIGFEL